MIISSQLGYEKCDALLNHAPVVRMGILNITPDSFSDGGLYCESSAAVECALDLISAGAHIIDVGGVSTRPGARPVSSAEEWTRVEPVLRALRQEIPQNILLSLDTSSPIVAYQAAREGLLDIINDVFAGRARADDLSGEQRNVGFEATWTTAHVASKFNLGLILMHMQGDPQSMQDHPRYNDCVEEVAGFLEERLKDATGLGVRWCALDPGIGFGKNLEHNLSLLSEAGMRRLVQIGAPVLIGLSRKSFLKKLAERDGVLASFSNANEELNWRDQQSHAWERLCEQRGARIIRTHKMKQ